MKRTLPLVSALLLTWTIGAAPQRVGAQDYPNKPVRVIVPLAPGGATDIQARLYALPHPGERLLLATRDDLAVGSLQCFELSHQGPKLI